MILVQKHVNNLSELFVLILALILANVCRGSVAITCKPVYEQVTKRVREIAC